MEKTALTEASKFVIFTTLLNSSNQEVQDGTARLGEKFSAFYGATGFITVFIAV